MLREKLLDLSKPVDHDSVHFIVEPTPAFPCHDVEASRVPPP